MITLTEHLQAGAAQPFVWGAHDCCLWPSDWMKARRGVDPAAPLRGRYGTAFAAYRHIQRLGGFEVMVRALMADAGFAETNTPQPGDVGIIETDQGPALAIRTQRGWAANGPTGVTCAPFDHLVAWTI